MPKKKHLMTKLSVLDHLETNLAWTYRELGRSLERSGYVCDDWKYKPHHLEFVYKTKMVGLRTADFPVAYQKAVDGLCSETREVIETNRLNNKIGFDLHPYVLAYTGSAGWMVRLWSTGEAMESSPESRPDTPPTPDPFDPFDL